MRVTYTPEDGDQQDWEWDPDRVRQSHAELVEKRYGRPWELFVVDVQAGNAKARRVLLWHLMCRQHHTLRYEDTPDFYMGELKVEHSLDELTEIRDRTLKANMPEDERQELLTALDLGITEQLAKGEEPGKAPSPASEGATG